MIKINLKFLKSYQRGNRLSINILPEASFSSATIDANGIIARVMRKTVRILHSANQHLRVKCKIG